MATVKTRRHRRKESTSGYFRKIFDDDHALVHSKSNEELIRSLESRSSQASEKQFKKVKQNLANLKSLLRKKDREGPGGGRGLSRAGAAHAIFGWPAISRRWKPLKNISTNPLPWPRTWIGPAWKASSSFSAVLAMRWFGNLVRVRDADAGICGWDGFQSCQGARGQDLMLSRAPNIDRGSAVAANIGRQVQSAREVRKGPRCARGLVRPCVLLKSISRTLFLHSGSRLVYLSPSGEQAFSRM